MSSNKNQGGRLGNSYNNPCEWCNVHFGPGSRSGSDDKSHIFLYILKRELKYRWKNWGFDEQSDLPNWGSF